MWTLLWAPTVDGGLRAAVPERAAPGALSQGAAMDLWGSVLSLSCHLSLHACSPQLLARGLPWVNAPICAWPGGLAPA